MKKPLIWALSLILSLTGCQHPSQNSYNAADVGKSSLVVFGKVIAERPVDIKEETSGVGATAGAAAGAVGGSAVGGGRGALLAVIAGAVIGGVAGHMAEQGIINHNGIEYTIKTVNPGKTFKPIITLAQNIASDDKPIAIGSCVMVQTGGTYQRVLPVDDADLCKSSKHRKPKKDEDEDN